MECITAITSIYLTGLNVSLVTGSRALGELLSLWWMQDKRWAQEELWIVESTGNKGMDSISAVSAPKPHRLHVYLTVTKK